MSLAIYALALVTLPTSQAASTVVSPGRAEAALVTNVEAAEESTAQVIIQLPDLTPDQRLVLKTAALAALQGTKEHGRKTIEAAASGGIAATLDGDELRIGMTFDPSNAAAALSVLESILVRPAFLPEVVAKAAIAATTPDPSPWNSAQQLPIAPYRSVLPIDVETLWPTVVQPSRVTIAFGGAKAEELKASWTLRKTVWPAAPFARYLPAGKIATVTPFAQAKVVVLHGEPTTPTPTMLLALTLLGCGKGSLGWKILRLDRGTSYRVESTIASAEGKAEGRLVFDLPIDGDAGAAIDGLKASIDGIGEGDLSRAKGYLIAGLDGESLDIVLPQDLRTLQSRTYLQAWWLSTTGAKLDVDLVKQSLENVSLNDVKIMLVRFLDSARVSTLAPNSDPS